MADIFSLQKRKDLMSRVKSKNTNIELILRKRLWAAGYRYRIHYKLFGKPDIVFPAQKVAVFCDGDFWHGKNYDKEKFRYKKFWKEKIATNIERDKLVNAYLQKNMWKVVRFWKTEILKTPDKCLDKIRKSIKSRIHN